MNNNTEDLPLQASRDEDFVAVYDHLLEHLFLSKQPGANERLKPISSKSIQRATWLASIIALSRSEPLKNLANSFGALLYLYAPDNASYQRACYVLQSRSGNLLSSKHIPNILSNGKYKNSFGALLDLELGATRGRLTHKLENSGELIFTDYQARLWSAIEGKSHVAISAPTSAGKSFIIKKYIVEKLTKERKIAVFVVPTKALINQVSMEFKSDLKQNAHVYTTYRPTIENDKSTIFVLTPERCTKLLQDKTAESPSIAFIDEIHNLETNGRGMAFENSLYGLVTRFPKCQFIFAGPFIDDIVTPLQELSGLEILDETTIATPVFQIKAAITFIPKSNSAKYKLFSQTGNIIAGETTLTKKLYSKAKSKKGEAIASFLENLNRDESCIIFAPRKSTAENWALKILPVFETNSISQEVPSATQELIEFLAEEIHPNYSLIRTLRNGVAFHHAGLPDIARIEIEELYSSNEIKSLVCTSTLLQGVNLPADKLIVITPKNDTTPLTPFEFMNLIGRAGRISTNLYGEVYCLDIETEEWGSKRLSNNSKATIKPQTTSTLKSHTQKIIALATSSRERIKEDDVGKDLYGTISYLRHLFVSDKKHFDRIVSTSAIPEVDRAKLEAKLTKLTSALTIPPSLLRQNPYVDPILQDKLYLEIKEAPYTWIPTSYPGQRRKKSGKDSEFSELSFYEQFSDIALRLDEIFKIEDEVNDNKFGGYIGIENLIYDSYKWMSGKPHRYFIEKHLRRSEEQNDEDEHEDEPKSDPAQRAIDRAARFVTGNISNNITFKLVKYFSLWSDIARACIPESDQEKYSYALGLPSMIELGSYDPKVLELMSLGVNRSIALKIRQKMPSTVENVETWLQRFNTASLSPILRRYLERSGLTKHKRPINSIDG